MNKKISKTKKISDNLPQKDITIEDIKRAIGPNPPSLFEMIRHGQKKSMEVMIEKMEDDRDFFGVRKMEKEKAIDIREENLNRIIEERENKNKVPLDIKIRNSTISISADGKLVLNIGDKKIKFYPSKNAPSILLEILHPFGSRRAIENVFYKTSKKGSRNEVGLTNDRMREVLENRNKELQREASKHNLLLKLSFEGNEVWMDCSGK